MKTLSFSANALIVLCGPSGSGKSYFAQKYFQPSQIVSSDNCREMIGDDASNQRITFDAFELFYQIIKYRLRYNRLVVADATHLVMKARGLVLELAKTFERPIDLVLFDTDAEHCLKHNSLRPRNVEPNIIARHLELFALAKTDVLSERFDKIYTLCPDDIETLRINLIPI